MAVKVCSAPKCCHSMNLINTNVDSFVQDSGKYYHKDCFALSNIDKPKKTAVDEAAQKKADFAYIKNKWRTNVNRDTAFAPLTKVLNELVKNGEDTKYLVFVIDYVVENHCKLTYPEGFKYYVQDAKIAGLWQIKQKKRKDAKARQILESARVKTEVKQDFGQKFTPPPTRKKNFTDIFTSKSETN